MKKQRNGNSGFTLLEVILSITILGLVAVPLMKYFTDSLKYTAMTARQQKSTLLAQESLESLKAQDKLISKCVETDAVGNPVLNADGTAKYVYWVPNLAGKNEHDTTGEYQVSDMTGFDKTNGTTAAGKPLVLKKSEIRDGSEYDVYLSLSTDVDANAVVRPVIFGIDDTKTAMIVERDEEQEALLYFLALNTSYVANHAGGGPVPGAPTPTPDVEHVEVTPPPGAETPTPTPAGVVVTPTPAPGGSVAALDSVDNVRKFLQRDIYIEIGKEDVDPGYFTVRAWYEYSCSKVTNKTFDTFTTSDLLNTRVENLESVYLMFNIVDPEKDVIHVKWNIVSEAVKAPTLTLVCQNLDQLKRADGEATPTPTPTAAPGGEAPAAPFAFEAQTYSLTLDTNNATQGMWPGGLDPEIRTNLVNTDPAKNKGSVYRDASTTFTVKPLTSDGTSVRIVELLVQIFNKGDKELGKEPLVEMKTTKSE